MIYPFNVDTSCRFRLFVDYISPPCLKMERVINRSIVYRDSEDLDLGPRACAGLILPMHWNLVYIKAAPSSQKAGIGP